MLSVIMFLSKLKYLIYLIATITTITFIYLWWIIGNNQPCVTVPDWYAPSVADQVIKDAMRKMGPYYHYKMVGDKLYVNKGDGKWRRLRYDK